MIGREASNVSPVAALDHVAGWTIVNDVSSRDAWLDGDQWLIGKSLPGFCPVGPRLVARVGRVAHCRVGGRDACRERRPHALCSG